MKEPDDIDVYSAGFVCKDLSSMSRNGKQLDAKLSGTLET